MPNFLETTDHSHPHIIKKIKIIPSQAYEAQRVQGG
jgi:hypothetical protein